MAAAPLGAQEEFRYRPLFDWDLISLEQNNPRFNGSALTGFHSLRSPGVTPRMGWKTGLGIHYTREVQVSQTGGAERFNRTQLVFNPKLNYGLYHDVEAGVGFVASYTRGRDLVTRDGSQIEITNENPDVSAVDLGAKWLFLDLRDASWLDGHPLRLGFSFDTRLALRRGAFGTLSANFFNFELDTDFALTNRLSLASNFQLLTNDGNETKAQAIADIASVYTFTDTFRGMLFGTIQEDDQARTALGFVGIAGQYVVEQHSFTLAFDLLLNDANRELRSVEQLDVMFAYAFTF